MTTRDRHPRRLRAAALAGVTLLSLTTLATRVEATAVTGGAPIADSDNPALAGTAHTSLRIHTGDGLCSAGLLADGWVLTAEHCVDTLRDNTAAAPVSSTSGPNAVYAADAARSATGIDYAVAFPDLDVALLRTSTDLTAQTGPGLEIASTAARIGDTVHMRGWDAALGAGDHDHQITGTITDTGGPARAAVTATYHDGWQHGGDSGGMVLDDNGRIVSLVSVGLSQGQHSSHSSWNVSAGPDVTALAPLLDTVRSVMDDATTAESATAAYQRLGDAHDSYLVTFSGGGVGTAPSGSSRAVYGAVASGSSQSVLGLYNQIGLDYPA